VPTTRDVTSPHEQLSGREPGASVGIGTGTGTDPGSAGALAVQQLRAAHSEQMFRMLVESVSDYAIFLLDATGHVATWNVGAQRIKGYSLDEIVGRHFSIFYTEDEKHSGKCELELEVAAREGRFEDEGWRVRKDGSRFWANVVISAVRNERGELVGFSKVTRDLTERKAAEDERTARLAAEHANRAKDEFLAVLGHELRNPLAPIATALQVIKLRSDGELPREYQVIERQLGHMMHLVDDLLDVSRIVQGKVVLKNERIELRTVIAKAIETANPLIDQRQHQLDVKRPARPLVVHGDDARLTQVFTNLLVNAAKYTDPGGRIVVTMRQVDDDIAVEIRDDGIGMEPALVARVFDLFMQGNRTSEHKRGGLGIGLALVRKLVGLHGGTVEASSPGPGRGSTFTVRLPSAEPRKLDSAPVVLRSPAVEHAPRRILLVDDNEDALMLLGDALAASGHDVRTAAGPAAAIEIARTFQPEIAILDIGLPDMDGYELASKLRDVQGNDKLHLIALTGYGQESDRARSAQAGFRMHFVKPVDIRRLRDVIAQA
jgi:PAS domain S-box-containing protein